MGCYRQVQGHVSNPVIADFDLDGAPDVVFASDLFSGVQVLNNAGDGTLVQFANVFFMNGVPTSPIRLADFNGDGKPDLAVVDVPGTTSSGDLSNTEVTVLLNTAPLQFPLLLGGVVNAASGSRGALAPGSLASAYTLPQRYRLQTANILPLPRTLENAALLLNSNPVPLLALSPSQINFQVPWELTGMFSGPVAFQGDTVYTFPLQPGWQIRLATFSPGIFTMNEQGTGQGAVTIANSAAIAAPIGAFPVSHPASRGEYITIFGTGLGPVENQPASGSPALAKPLSTTKFQPTVTIGDAAAVVQFSGLAPGFVGVNQINVQVPANAPTGDAVQLVIQTADGSHSNVVTIAIK
jgi:uncharacterized protein (TIGR03437 family)